MSTGYTNSDDGCGRSLRFRFRRLSTQMSWVTILVLVPESNICMVERPPYGGSNEVQKNIIAKAILGL